MHRYSLTHVRDEVLLRDLTTLVERDRATTAKLLAHIAEVDARRLYAGAGYTSMHAYCVEKLRLSDDEAYKRITAARAARRFPDLFGLLAAGRLHLTAIRLLAPHLTPDNARELVAAAVDRRSSEIELELSRRFPPEAGRLPARLATKITPVVERPPHQSVTSLLSNPAELVAGRVEATLPDVAATVEPSRENSPAPARPAEPALYRLEVTLPKAAHDRLRYAQALLGHAVPSGDVAGVIDRALEALITQLEKRKFGASPRPRAGAPRFRRPGRRLIPAHVRRAVWQRDDGLCTFVGPDGHRCGSRRRIEFDHVVPIARGGWSTVENLRLRCRTHNQYEAERAFGASFMESRRKIARGHGLDGQDTGQPIVHGSEDKPLDGPGSSRGASPEAPG